MADLNMPEMDGIELTEQISKRFAHIKVVILTMHDKRGFVDRAFAAGAKGYLLKDADIDQLSLNIKRIYAGEIILDHNLSC